MSSEKIKRLPVVSVVVACYNYGHFLRETLESVQNQTYQNWECVVVDDGSKDDTKEVARTFVNSDRRFIYVYQKNKGLSAARNTGIRHSKGEYIQFLDADDLIEREKLNNQTDFLERAPNYGLVYSYAKYFDNSKSGFFYWAADGSLNKWMPELDGSLIQQITELLKKNIMAVSCPLIRKDLVTNTGFFNTSLNSLEDWEYWLRASMLKHKFFFSQGENTSTLIRTHPSSMSKNSVRMVTNEIKIRRRIHSMLDNYYKEQNEKYFEKALRAYVNIKRQMGFNNIYRGSFPKGLQEIFSCQRASNDFTLYWRDIIYWTKRRLTGK